MRTTQTTIEGKGDPAAPPLSGALAFRAYYDAAAGALMLSVNGGPYAPIPTSSTDSWNRDTALAPPQIEPDNAGDVLAFSSAGTDVPAGSKVLFESSPSIAGAVLEVQATGEPAGAVFPPDPGSTAIKITRNRTAPLVFPDAMTQLAIVTDTFAGDGFGLDLGLGFFANNTAGLAPGAGFAEGIYFIGNADGNAYPFDRMLATIDSTGWISTYNATAGLPAPDIAIFTFPNGTPGEPGGEILIQINPTNGIQPPDIRLEPGWDSAAPAAGPHGTVRAVSLAAAQVPLTMQGIAGQTANLSEWQLSTNYTTAAISANGAFKQYPRNANPGGGSATIVQACNTSVASDEEWTVAAFGEAATDVSRLIWIDPDANSLLQLERNRVGAPFSSVAFLGGSGAQQSARPGQITDNSGGASTGAVAAIVGSGADAAFNDIHATLLARINAMEQKLKDLGLFS